MARGFDDPQSQMNNEEPANAIRHKKHLWGWLSYAFASEVFVVVSLTLFLPICLEQFARDNGFVAPERTKPCSTGSITTADEGRCVVKLGWAWIDTASFSLYVNSMSVALQALTVISMGGIADHPQHRKRLLLLFAFIGAVSAMGFFILPSSSPFWTISALFAIVSNICFGVSVVAMNAYLPSLARSSKEVVYALGKLNELVSQEPTQSPSDSDESGQVISESEDAHLLEGNSSELLAARQDYSVALSSATSRISSRGIASGYLAGIILLIIALVPVSKLHGSTLSLRLAIGMSGVWWAFFSLPAAALLPAGTTAELVNDAGAFEKWTVRGQILAAWKRLGGMLRWSEIKKLRNTFRYLAAWFLLSDGFTTITSTAILFAKTTLYMPSSSLILIGVITPSSGILGSLVWPYFQRRFAYSNLRMLVILVGLASLIPAYGCLGFLPILQRARFGGLTSPGEMYALAIYFGCVYGAFQGYARAFYAELIPHGEEARWYGLFSITDKSSSFVGPLVVGLIADVTGNIRYAFFFLVFMIWLAVPVLMSVDVEVGRADAERYSYRSG